MKSKVLPFLPTDRVFFPNNSASILVTTRNELTTIEHLATELREKGSVLLAVFTKVQDIPGRSAELFDVGNGYVSRTGVVVRVVDVKRLLQGTQESCSLSVQVCSRCSMVEFNSGDNQVIPSCVIHTREPIIPPALSSDAIQNFSRLKIVARKLIPSLRSARAIALSTYLRSHHVLPDVLTDTVAALCTRGDLSLKLRILDEDSVENRLNLVLQLAEQQLAQVGSSWDGGSSQPYVIAVIDNKHSRGKSPGGHSISTPSEDEDMSELRKALSNSQIPPRVRSLCEKEIARLGRMSTSSPDYSMTRLYLETLLDIPWGKESSTASAETVKGGYAASIDAAKNVLDSYHCGMASVKKRILEFIAVQCLEAHAAATQTQKVIADSNSSGTQPPALRKSPTILCLVGPPGVGKTSLGSSIASALGRKFERIALGGVNNESTLRGHRRTYVGAIPGRIVQALRSAECMNPVILLDEIDKLGVNSLGGDPAAALLEILDPNQNHAFADHFIGQPIDLSKVIFIATANRAEGISAPLLDRMELLTLSGYSLQEKQHIASHYLLPKQAAGSYLDLGTDIDVLPSAIVEVITGYTREAGVRQLEMRIGSICRHVAMKKAHVISGGSPEGPDGHDFAFPVVVTAEDVANILGPRKFHSDGALDEALPGVATGMAWTSAGGELLFIESSCYFKNGSQEQNDHLPLELDDSSDSRGNRQQRHRRDNAVVPARPFSRRGGGSIHVTGSLGDVMKESCHIALSWLRSNASMVLSKAAEWKEKTSLGNDAGEIVNSYLPDVEAKILNSCVHVHVPCGSVSKDGPSAGCAILMSLISMVTGITVDPLTAVTGELTLRGAVLPVGGIREKILAAQRGGIKRVMMPTRNIDDLTDETRALIEGIEIIPIKKVEDILEHSIFSMELSVASSLVSRPPPPSVRSRL